MSNQPPQLSARSWWHSGEAISQAKNTNPLDIALSQFEAAAFNFAQRSINDASIRQQYITQTRRLSVEFRTKVMAGSMSAEAAADAVNRLRNDILAAQRLRSSDIGRASAVNLKRSGLTLSELVLKYSQKLYQKPFNRLSMAERERVYLEIIESSGRARPSVNLAAQRVAVLGRSLLIVTTGIAVYNIAVAEEKGKAALREGVIIGGGFAGGAAGGALAGLACGPGAPVCVTVGVFVGGALGSLGADASFGWFLK